MRVCEVIMALAVVLLVAFVLAVLKLGVCGINATCEAPVRKTGMQELPTLFNPPSWMGS